MAEGASLSVMQREIEARRQELAVAVADVEAAARDLTRPAHWARVARGVFERHPEVCLAMAFGVGVWIGFKTAPRREISPAV